MYLCLLIIGIFLCPPVVYTDNDNSNTSVTQATWFWPLISICIALLLSIPCITVTVLMYCYHKHSFDDSSIVESNELSSSNSSISLPRRLNHHHHHHHHHPQPSHYVGAYRSPPPPYISSDQPANVFVSPSLPPPYESHIRVEPTVINVRPIDVNETQSSINQPTPSQIPATLDESSTLINASLQTFQA